MRSDTATTGKVRLVIVLSVAAAVVVMLGVIVVAASLVMRSVTKHQPAHMTKLGLDTIAAGAAFGLVVLVGYAIARLGGAGRPRPRAGGADHRKGAGSQQQGGRDRHRAGGPPAGGHAGREGGTRSPRRPVLKPTNVYTPGGLIDVPRDGRAPGPPGGQPIPEILRTAGPPPGAPAGGRNQERPPAGRAGNQPRPGYQPGTNPGGPARAPYAYGGQPMPPREHGYPREAPRPGQARPPREPVPPREGMPPHEGMPPYRAAPPPPKPQAAREAPRPGMGPGAPGGPGAPAGPGRPGGPVRQGGAMPPHDPGYHPPTGQAGQRSGPGRHAAGPGPSAPGPSAPGAPGHAAAGHAGPDGRRPGAHGRPGHQGPGGPEAFGQFDGGYAPVIRASDYPARPAGPARPPGFGRSADPAGMPGPAAGAGGTPADVYVYRDTSGPAAAPGPGEHDPDYWYDLQGAGSGSGGAKPQVAEEARGPFEPLLSSAGPPGAAPRPASGAVPRPASGPDSVSGPAEPQDAAHIQARKLEQIKDLYLTAEAIGEANVDKHFDQLLAQQRELIGEYFRQSTAARPASAEGQQDPGAREAAAESAGVAAEQPRAW